MEFQSRTLFVVLARGGSKRLPGKNLLEVGGVPLIGRAVRNAHQAARRLGNPARVVVSTDDERIAHAARQWGAETPFQRPAELATDTATTVDALIHVVDRLAEHGDTCTEVVLVQPTSPLCQAEDVVRAVTAYRQDSCSSVVTVRPATHAQAGIRFGLLDDTLIESAAASPANSYVELNGAVYVCSPQWLRSHDRLCIPGETHAVMMPIERSIDVDTTMDLELARSMWEQSLLWKPGRCLVIAEAGVNHNGCLDTARRLIDVAADAGADAVKFQTFSADRLAIRSAPKAAYQRKPTSANESQFEMLKRLELSPDDHWALKTHCDERNVVFLSSAFGKEDVDLLDEMDVAAIKLGSAEITNHPLLTHVGATHRPVVLSTGCSWLHEVAEAVDVLRDSGCCELALLHCVSHYPADPADVNLRAMETLRRAFNLPTGYSDHTLGIEVASAAVACGARIVEKHFTLDRTMPGPDHRASLEPKELAMLVKAVRHVEAAMGDGIKRPTDSESDTRIAARKSLVGTMDLPAGMVLEPKHLTAKRPATGICPSRIEAVLGMCLCQSLSDDEPLTWEHLRAQGNKP